MNSESFSGSQDIVALDPPDSPDLLDPPSPRELQPLLENEYHLEERVDYGLIVGAEMSNEDSTSVATITYVNEDSHASVVSVASSSRNLEPFDEESNSNFPPPIQVSNISAQIDEPPNKVMKLSPKEDNIDGESCPICLDSWANSGQHRLVSLKCGHLFGLKCVERWLKHQPVKERVCPTCKSKASVRDIRTIYARCLISVDNSEITALKKEIEVLHTHKNKLELELHITKKALHSSQTELATLKNSLTSTSQKRSHAPRNWKFVLEKNLEICKEGDSRVMAYNCRTYELYTSQKSSNNLFPGYGIRKVNCLDYKLGQFLHLHTKPIRDITYSQPSDLVLSASLDSTAKLIERGMSVTTVQTGVPLWSCAWNCSNNNEFYVGGASGYIQLFDVRNLSSCVARLPVPGDISPVISLCPTDFGLLSCHLNSCWLWSYRHGEHWEPRAMPVEGPFMSMNYDSHSQSVLICGKPGTNHSGRSKIFLCKLKPVNSEFICNVEETFQGSARTTLMSRSTLVNASGAFWGSSYSECDASIILHGLNNTTSLSIPTIEPVLDLCSFQINGDTMLAALSKTRVRIYKGVPLHS